MVLNINYDVKRAWIISDTHFGVKSNSIKWLNVQTNFFNNLEQNIIQNFKDGDILIHCGDLFDNRQSINIMVQNRVQEILERLSKILPIIIIIGNHDIYKKTENDVNSLKFLNHMPNVYPLENISYLNILNSSKQICFLPWVYNKTDETNIIDQIQSDYLFSHSDVSNVLVNKNATTKHGVNVEKYQKFIMAYTGHIHWNAKIGNLQICGTPYQLDRGDIGNSKKYYLHDFSTDKVQDFYNKNSPRFSKVHLKELLDQDIDIIKEQYKNTYLDLYINQEYMNIDSSKIYELFKSCAKLEIHFTQDLDDYDLDSSKCVNLNSNNDILKVSKIILEERLINNNTITNVLNKLDNLINNNDE